MPVCAVANFSSVIRCATLAAIVLATGCSVIEPQPTLTYTADTTAAPPKNKQIILNPFIDHRADKTSVGTVRSTFGANAAEVVPANDVTQWVIDAIKTELQQNGYVVTLGSSGKDNLPGASAAMSGVIAEVSCKSNHAAKVVLLGKISGSGKDVMNKNYLGVATAPSVWGSPAKLCAQSLADALANSVKPFVADLEEVLASR
ncbi:MAG: hypothetical protein JWN94_897 [Betaproteobacteria bacterium]|nr:hypothetical protein [Betaproteobacteria bacterium]